MENNSARRGSETGRQQLDGGAVAGYCLPGGNALVTAGAGSGRPGCWWSGCCS